MHLNHYYSPHLCGFFWSDASKCTVQERTDHCQFNVAGIDFKMKGVSIDGKRVRLQLWWATLWIIPAWGADPRVYEVRVHAPPIFLLQKFDDCRHYTHNAFSGMIRGRVRPVTPGSATIDHSYTCPVKHNSTAGGYGLQMENNTHNWFMYLSQDTRAFMGCV